MTELTHNVTLPLASHEPMKSGERLAASRAGSVVLRRLLRA
jgi:hypothetical protein